MKIENVYTNNLLHRDIIIFQTIYPEVEFVSKGKEGYPVLHFIKTITAVFAQAEKIKQQHLHHFWQFSYQNINDFWKLFL